MEEIAVKGTSDLLEYGVLGIFCLMFVGVIVYLQKQNKSTITLLLDSKDQETQTWKDQATASREQVTTVLAGVSNNTTKLIELFQSHEDAIKEIPEKTAKELRLISLDPKN